MDADEYNATVVREMDDEREEDQFSDWCRYYGRI